ncbi:MAG: septum formation inhibitor Maf [Burkholderiaceae bacterium]|nr:septum formation inhibitor Maf [Burkholderiaceae bacterium]
MPAAPKPSADFIYLASQSPRRRQLLDQLGVPHRPLLPEPGPEAEAAEALEAVLPGEAPAAYVQRVTALKLKAAQARARGRGLPPAPILCADTTVALGRRILGKPADAAEAAAMLAALSGRAHKVHTAVAVAASPTSRKPLAALSSSTVEFAALPAMAIAAYIATGEPFGKAGAYAIQSAWGGRIARIAGSYTGIMGLPLFETAELLRQLRLNC